MSEAIAIIGMACRYPDANTPSELWENVLSQRRSFRRMPPERLRLEDYFSPDRSTPDATYNEHVAVLENYQFDRVAHRISGGTFRATDMTHWLALDVAEEALAAAGVAEHPQVSRDRVGVIVGNTLTGEFSRAALLRLRWPYIRRVVGSSLARHGWHDDERAEFLAELEEEFKAPFEPVGDDTLAGALSNTIAGRICNVLDLHGGGYAVDGACSSSLLSVVHAAVGLRNGDLDLALAGGVDLSLDPFELVGFAKTSALASRLMRVFDTRAEGFWPGEGCGFLVLARLDDALSWGATIYAVLRGWGISSDGTGGITRPEQTGQLLAIRRAYSRAGYGPDTVPLFEGHGTGTPVGDAVELATLESALSADGASGTAAAIGSVKANIGHTKAAAGAASLIKTVMALHHQVVPPITGCDDPRPELVKPDAKLRVVRDPELWPEDRPLRAGVSSMGFGGINAHLTVEGLPQARVRRLSSRQRELGMTSQDSELIPVVGTSVEVLRERLQELVSVASRLSFGDLRDLAIKGCAESGVDSPARAAILASTPRELAEKASRLVRHLDKPGGTLLDVEGGCFSAISGAEPRIGFLFPGQAAPTYTDGGAIARRFGLHRHVGLPAADDPKNTAVAQPAIVASELVGLDVLSMLGVNAVLAVGHSVGEVAALHWAGAVSAEDAIELARVRGRIMGELPGDPGTMADIAAEESVTRALIVDLPVAVAALNASDHTVISGPSTAVKAAADRAQKRGIKAMLLPVSHAFHSPLVASAAEPFGQYLAGLDLRLPREGIVSTVTGEPLRRDTDLVDHLKRQVTEPVRFTAALDFLVDECDLLLEVGPGHVLSPLVSKLPVVAMDAGGASLAGVLAAAAATWVLGAPTRLSELSVGRVARSGDPLGSRSFLANPCESGPAESGAQGPTAAKSDPETPSVSLDTASSGDVLSVVRQLVADRTELPVEFVSAESRMLSELRLNSITVAQLASEAAATVGVRSPMLSPELADATVQEFADLLGQMDSADSDSDAPPSGVATWIRPFELRWEPDRRSDAPATEVSWTVLPREKGSLADSAREAFTGQYGQRGVVICVPADRSVAAAGQLLEMVHSAVDEIAAERIVFLHYGDASGLAATMAWEYPNTTTCAIEIPPGASVETLRSACDEAVRREGFVHFSLNESGELLKPSLHQVTVTPDRQPLGPDDVLLVTGGGKGIGAECALTLAEDTGAALAVVGRSSPEEDTELARNIERFRERLPRFVYERADVTDRPQLAEALGTVERELGPVTGIIHAAGANQPRLLRQLDEAALAATLGPKLDGLRNLLSIVDNSRLRLLVPFGSIIARMGMTGEADYALANTWLRRETEVWAAGHPDCRTAMLEWSVWSDAGMGERLGRIEMLSEYGVTPITPEAGTRLLSEIVSSPGLPSSLVVTGRFGQPPTLLLPRSDLPLARFLERPRVHYNGIELVCDAQIDIATDPYLDDHTLEGTAILPAVLGLEAMAQAAGALSGGDITGFQDVELSQPVTIPSQGARTIRVAALTRSPGVVEAVIRSEETGFAVDHFRARCLSDAPEFDSADVRPTGDVGLDIARDLYESLLFHGDSFRRVEAFDRLQSKESRYVIITEPEATWFGEYLPQVLTLGDPGARDAFIHALQACLPGKRHLPAGIEAVSLRRAPSGRLAVSAIERERTPDMVKVDLTARDEEGQVVESWRGLQMRAISPLALPDTWPLALFVPYTERKLHGCFGTRAIELGVHTGTDDAVDRTAQAVSAAVGLPTKVVRRSDGRPETAAGDVEISAAHHGSLTLAISAQAPVACDIEGVTARDPSIWRDMLTSSRTAAVQAICDGYGEDFDTAATRIWCASECLSKLGRGSTEPITVKTARAFRDDDLWVFLTAGSLQCATIATRLDGIEEKVVAGFIVDTSAGSNA